MMPQFNVGQYLSTIGQLAPAAGGLSSVGYNQHALTGAAAAGQPGLGGGVTSAGVDTPAATAAGGNAAGDATGAGTLPSFGSHQA